MRAGHPFKTRLGGRPTPGVLLTPDVLKFKVPSMIAFVPSDPKKLVNKKTGKIPQENKLSRPKLVSAGNYQISSSCQTQVMNLNRCIKNIGNQCDYYQSFLNRNCLKQ